MGNTHCVKHLETGYHLQCQALTIGNTHCVRHLGTGYHIQYQCPTIGNTHCVRHVGSGYHVQCRTPTIGNSHCVRHLASWKNTRAAAEGDTGELTLGVCSNWSYLSVSDFIAWVEFWEILTRFAQKVCFTRNNDKAEDFGWTVKSQQALFAKQPPYIGRLSNFQSRTMWGGCFRKLHGHARR